MCVHVCIQAKILLCTMVHMLDRNSGVGEKNILFGCHSSNTEDLNTLHFVT